MKLTSQLLDRFNQRDTVLIISKYPVKGASASHHGVATYTSHALKAITRQTKTKFVVLVENTFATKPYLDGSNILVIPTFNVGYWYPTELLRMVCLFPKIQVIHLHSEFITSGKPLQMALLMPLLFGLRLLGKKTFYTAHNVIDNFDFIASHLGKNRQDWTLQLLQKVMPLYYWTLAHLVNTVIVLDSSVQQRLSKYVSEKKLYLSPHWVHPHSVSSAFRRYWRKQMEYNKADFVIVCFGFMTKYKGVDWLFEAVEHAHRHIKDKNIKLILAGGRAPSQIGKKHYEQFYNQFAEKIAQSPHSILTGFIPENEISRYFAVADLVVLPYRGILGASGSWAQALAYQKPFLLSQELMPYTSSSDFLTAAQGISIADVVFRRNKHQFTQMLKYIIAKPKYVEKLTDLSCNLAQARSAKQRIAVELAELYTPQVSWISVQWQYVKNYLQALPTILAND